jgi:hypothetical protein
VKLLEKIAAAAEKAAMEMAWKKGLMRCPNCGQPPAQRPVDAETLMRCESCGNDALPSDWQPLTGGVRMGHPDQIPAGTRIRREGGFPGDCVWHIPASGKFGFFLFFGVIWTTITAVGSGVFLTTSFNEGSKSMPWFLYLFFVVFWAVGLGCLYAAVRNKYARHQITVTGDLVTLRREMFGRVKDKSLVTRDVESVEQAVFYQQNYQPVYGVEIRGRSGKIRFGTSLEEAEKAWLVADIKRAVFGEAKIENSRVAAVLPEVIAAQRQSSFSFPLPPTPKGYWMVGVVLILVGLGGLAMGIFNGPDFPSHGKDGIDWVAFTFKAVFGLFSLIPIIVGLVFGAIGVQLVSSNWPGRGLEKRLEGDEIQVALRTYQHGRVIKEQSFPRESVREARASRTGNANGTTMKRIDLIVDGKAKRITRWTAGDVADAWVADVCRALGR